MAEKEFHFTLDCYCTPTTCREMQLVCQPCLGVRPRESIGAADIWLQKPILGNLFMTQLAKARDKGHQQEINLAVALSEARSLEEAAASVGKALAAKLSSTLTIEKSELVENKPLHQYGVGSLALWSRWSCATGLRRSSRRILRLLISSAGRRLLLWRRKQPAGVGCRRDGHKAACMDVRSGVVFKNEIILCQPSILTITSQL